MKEKVLYYLGAGASAKVLPLARSVFDGGDYDPKIPGLIHELEFQGGRLTIDDLAPENQKYLTQVKRKMKALAFAAKDFGDIDTYAKFLHLMGRTEELKDLKSVLAHYFVIKQLIIKAIDSRYLPWLVSIMSKPNFPVNVKIISWNYDFQFQLAASKIGNLEEVKHNGNSFSYSAPSILYYPNLDPTFSDFPNISLYHMNGIAGIIRESIEHTNSPFQKNQEASNDAIISFLKNESLKSQIHFAWEQTTYHANAIQNLTHLILHTTILVVIGYSFPFFNREFDKEIMYELTRTGMLKKIYYQDPVLTGQQLKTQFGLHPDFDIVHIPHTDNFHIPFEY